MKILLTTLNPENSQNDLSLRYLYTVGGPYCDDLAMCEFNVFDSDEHIFTELVRENVDVIVLFCYTWNIDRILSIAGDLKAARPETTIVLGGPEVSYDAPDVLRRNPSVDVVMKGEGEYVFSQLCSYLNTDFPKMEDIRGITFRAGGEIVDNAPVPPVKMETIPFPYSKVPCENDKIVYYETTRGCPYDCSYCICSSTNGKKRRSLPVERVKGELAYFVHIGSKYIKFMDRGFNADPDRCIELIRYLKYIDDGSITFEMDLCGELIREDFLKEIETARKGMFRFNIDVRTTNPKALIEVNIPGSVMQALDNARALVDMGNCHVAVSIVAGLPYDGWKEIRKSFDDAYAIGADEMNIEILSLLKGTRLRNSASSHKYVYKNKAPYEVISNAYISAQDLVTIREINNIIHFFYNEKRYRRITNFLIERHTGSSFDFYEEFARFYYIKGYQHTNHSYKAHDNAIRTFSDYRFRQYKKHKEELEKARREAADNAVEDVADASAESAVTENNAVTEDTSAAEFAVFDRVKSSAPDAPDAPFAQGRAVPEEPQNSLYAGLPESPDDAQSIPAAEMPVSPDEEQTVAAVDLRGAFDTGMRTGKAGFPISPDDAPDSYSIKIEKPSGKAAVIQFGEQGAPDAAEITVDRSPFPLSPDETPAGALQEESVLQEEEALQEGGASQVKGTLQEDSSGLVITGENENVSLNPDETDVLQDENKENVSYTAAALADGHGAYDENVSSYAYDPEAVPEERVVDFISGLSDDEESDDEDYTVVEEIALESFADDTADDTAFDVQKALELSEAKRTADADANAEEDAFAETGADPAAEASLSEGSFSETEASYDAELFSGAEKTVETLISESTDEEAAEAAFSGDVFQGDIPESPDSVFVRVTPEKEPEDPDNIRMHVNTEMDWSRDVEFFNVPMRKPVIVSAAPAEKQAAVVDEQVPAEELAAEPAAEVVQEPAAKLVEEPAASSEYVWEQTPAAASVEEAADEETPAAEGTGAFESEVDTGADDAALYGIASEDIQVEATDTETTSPEAADTETAGNETADTETVSRATSPFASADAVKALISDSPRRRMQRRKPLRTAERSAEIPEARPKERIDIAAIIPEEEEFRELIRVPFPGAPGASIRLYEGASAGLDPGSEDETAPQAEKPIVTEEEPFPAKEEPVAITEKSFVEEEGTVETEDVQFAPAAVDEILDVPEEAAVIAEESALSAAHEKAVDEEPEEIAEEAAPFSEAEAVVEEIETVEEEPEEIAEEAAPDSEAEAVFEETETAEEEPEEIAEEAAPDSEAEAVGEEIETAEEEPLEPAPEAVPESVQEPAEEPIVEPAEEPVEEPAEEPAEEFAPEPVVELAEEPVEDHSEEPIVEPVVEPSEEPAGPDDYGSVDDIIRDFTQQVKAAGRNTYIPADNMSRPSDLYKYDGPAGAGSQDGFQSSANDGVRVDRWGFEIPEPDEIDFEEEHNSYGSWVEKYGFDQSVFADPDDDDEY